MPGATANPDDEAKLQWYAGELADAIEVAIRPWVIAVVHVRAGPAMSADLEEAALSAGRDAVAEIAPTVRTLLEQDIDDQTTTPLSILRGLVPHAAAVLADADIPVPARDAHAVELHPEDAYDLTPGGFDDFGDDVQAAGIAWGAAKAHVHLQRRRNEGRR